MTHPLLNRLCLACVLSAALVGVAAAQRPGSGAETKAWLELQKSQELSQDQVISGERAAQTWKRYVDSFGREIPETFQRDSVNSAGGGGGQR
jgi:hypothetical protein